jgi:Family of unknown function (DUF6448)
MPPHCDSLDGPVVTAARRALDADDVDLVLPFVPEEAETEVRAVFDRVRPARGMGETAREVAEFLAGVLHEELSHRLERVTALATTQDRSVPDARAYVEAVLGFEVYSHHLFQAMRAAAHEGGGHGHG